MVEPLLAAAAESAEQRLDAIVLLALMRKNRKAPGLEKVVADAARAPEARIAASLALWRAGEKAAKADSLVALLRSCPVDRDTKEETQERAAASSPVSHEARLWLMHAIARTKDARSLDALSEQAEDRDETVRATALLALSKLGLDRVPKVLERLTRDPDWSSPEIALALASIKDDPDARRRIYERLERAASAVESGKTSALSLGQLLNVIAGLRGEHALYNASPTCDSAYLENAREALLVWKRERR
jgi:HEAT repeat protein